MVAGVRMAVGGEPALNSTIGRFADPSTENVELLAELGDDGSADAVLVRRQAHPAVMRSAWLGWMCSVAPVSKTMTAAGPRSERAGARDDA